MYYKQTQNLFRNKYHHYRGINAVHLSKNPNHKGIYLEARQRANRISSEMTCHGLALQRYC